MTGPMNGVKIVDLSIALAGPWAVSVLADQGASVIKLEPPGLGDAVAAVVRGHSSSGRPVTWRATPPDSRRNGTSERVLSRSV